MDFRAAKIKALLRNNEEKKKQEAARGHCYRGGNAGILVHGTPAGSCARAAIARANGRFVEHSYNTDLMFDMGIQNEVRWLNILKDAGYDARSADDLVQATTTSGKTPITGSPDILLYEGGKPFWGVELKHISSFWTFRDVVVEGKPKLNNLAQAGFYSMMLDDLPFTLKYTSSVNFSGPSFLTNLVPKPTERGSENFDYTYYQYTGNTKTYKGKKTKEKRKLVVPGHLRGEYPIHLFSILGADFAEFKNTIPTIIEYKLRWADRTLEYLVPGQEEYTRSIITKDNIMAFYDLLEECEATKTLPPLPINVDATGEVKTFDLVAYDSLAQVHEKHGHDYDAWLREALLVNY